MSRNDHPGRSAEDWKERQDVLAEKRVRQFLESLKEGQDKLKPNGKDFNDSLAELSHSLNEMATHLGADNTEVHHVVGTPNHHEAVIQADHGFASDPSIPIAFATFYVMKELTDVLDAVKGQLDLIGEKTAAEISASVAKAWDQFKDSAAQIIDGLGQRMTELVSPEKTQDKDAPDPEQAKLQDGQEKERVDQADKIAERRDKLEKKYEDAPADVRQGHLDNFDAAAKAVAAEQEARHAAELQRALEKERSKPSGPDR
jgi:hypothetical protein